LIVCRPIFLSRDGLVKPLASALAHPRRACQHPRWFSSFRSAQVPVDAHSPILPWADFDILSLSGGLGALLAAFWSDCEPHLPPRESYRCCCAAFSNDSWTVTGGPPLGPLCAAPLVRTRTHIGEGLSRCRSAVLPERGWGRPSDSNRPPGVCMTGGEHAPL